MFGVQKKDLAKKNLKKSKIVEGDEVDETISLDLRSESNEDNNDKKPRKYGFRLQGKSMILTYPQCDVTKEHAMLQLKRIRDPFYVCVSQERHEDGNPHLHAFVQYSEKQTYYKKTCFDIMNESERIIYHGNYQTAKYSDAARNYVMKDDNFIEHGLYQSNNQSSVQKRAQENKRILETALPELVNNGEISIYSYQALRTAKNLYTLDSLVVPDYMPKECIWIYGSTGIGKSRYIRDNHGGQFFSKSQNKWWDGYNGEKIVLIDDFDLKGEHLGHYLKIWADCYSFTAEIKGGSIKPVIDKLYITSQYLPRDIWCQGNDQEKWDNELRKAVERRFTIMTIDTDGRTLIKYPSY